MIALPPAKPAKQSSVSESGLIIFITNSEAVFLFLFYGRRTRILFLFYGAHFLLLCFLKAIAVPISLIFINIVKNQRLV